MLILLLKWLNDIIEILRTSLTMIFLIKNVIKIELLNTKKQYSHLAIVL
jgi:hypothetical protein